MNFSEPHRIAKLLRNYNGIWMIAGGWAIDLYLNRETRSHKDIEIAIPRNDQLELKSYLKNWNFRYVESGKFFVWKEKNFLNLPIHEIHGELHNKSKIEILLNEVENDKWRFRRNLTIEYPLNRLLIRSKQDIPILCPEIVLLYKAKFNTETDRTDLLNIHLTLSESSVKWLIRSILNTYGNHEWIRILSRKNNSYNKV